MTILAKPTAIAKAASRALEQTALTRGSSAASHRFKPLDDERTLPPAEPVPARVAGGRAVIVDNLIKSYDGEAGRVRVLDGISFDIGPGEKIAVLGKNGAGKSTLVKLIGGVEQPTSGLVHRGLSMSWPLSFGGGGMVNTMSGLDNTRFIARIYNRPIEETIDFVADFAELGKYLRYPVKTYSSGMRMRLAFALSMAIDFECYLIDEVLGVGDQRFQKKCREALFGKIDNSAMILVSHHRQTILEYCTKALVLKRGRSRLFDDVEFALDLYSTL
ncbi:ABC transporter ATP-binding protein [Jiella avicenniae]|uniref:ATP-binding cassette domain-containing protein n=1 Tax=Jiella avicenniae TaxID=2907202 RepID=A0A9X1P4L0_9HYPH|nr:ABC transporter ATP-binding protein [Jiella avicenniae]MCE7029166.1 ATP-binding cassette domain-containing protein [Jiella avicenniae]